jgi:hypothetical protein
MLRCQTIIWVSPIWGSKQGLSSRGHVGDGLMAQISSLIDDMTPVFIAFSTQKKVFIAFDPMNYTKIISGMKLLRFG